MCLHRKETDAKPGIAGTSGKNTFCVCIVCVLAYFSVRRWSFVCVCVGVQRIVLFSRSFQAMIQIHSVLVCPRWFFRTQFLSSRVVTKIRKSASSFQANSIPTIQTMSRFVFSPRSSTASRWPPCFPTRSPAKSINETNLVVVASEFVRPQNPIHQEFYSSSEDLLLLLYSVMPSIMASARVESGRSSPAGSSSASAIRAISTFPLTT